MKKVLAGIATALLTVILCLTMAGCDKSGNIKKAFEDEGYTVTEMTTKDNSSVETILSAFLTKDQIAEVGEYSAYIVSQKIAIVDTPVAVYIKFSSSSELKDFLTTEDSDGKKDTSKYDEANKQGWINENCLIITVIPKVLEIFKNA